MNLESRQKKAVEKIIERMLKAYVEVIQAQKY